MLLSFRELLRCSGLQENIDSIVNAFNSLGFEVESVRPFVDLEGLKFGRVVKTYKNLNADHLTVCEVTFPDKVRVIQTAAKNVKKGDYVVAFVEGARKENTIFGVKKLKGVISEGMLASWQELGFNTKLLPSNFQEGVAILDKVDLSWDPIQHLELDDYLIEVSVLTNRPDANSYFVLAEELRTFFNLSSKDAISNFSTTHLPLIFEINATDLELITKKDFLFLAKHDLVAKKSEEALRGLIALKYGAWSQVYAAPQEEGSFEVYSQNSLFLDGKQVLRLGYRPEQEFLLTPTTKVLRLAVCPISREIFRKLNMDRTALSDVGGILSKQGGFVFLEVAEYLKTKFKKVVVRTNIEPKIHHTSVLVDVNLLEQYTNIKNILDTRRGRQALGQLKCLGFEVKGERASPPSYRSNINNSEEFVEEFVRFFGYNNLEPSAPKLTNLLVQSQPKLEAKLSGLGYQEFLTFTLVKPENNIFNPFNFCDAERLITQAASGRQEIRKSVFNTMVESLRHNVNRNITRFSVFDVGLVATEKLSLFMATSLYNFQALKQQIVSLFPRKRFTFVSPDQNNEFLIPHLSEFIKEEGRTVGWIGSIKPAFFEQHNFLFCELLLKDFKNNVVSSTAPTFYKPYNKQSLKHRSVTFTLKQKESSKEHVDSLQKHPGVFQIFLKDVFESGDAKKVTFDVLLEEGFEDAFDKKYN